LLVQPLNSRYTNSAVSASDKGSVYGIVVGSPDANRPLDVVGSPDANTPLDVMLGKRGTEDVRW
jgi:hypothetical protein